MVLVVVFTNTGNKDPTGCCITAMVLIIIYAKCRDSFFTDITLMVNSDTFIAWRENLFANITFVIIVFVLTSAVNFFADITLMIMIFVCVLGMLICQCNCGEHAHA